MGWPHLAVGQSCMVGSACTLRLRERCWLDAARWQGPPEAPLIRDRAPPIDWVPYHRPFRDLDRPDDRGLRELAVWSERVVQIVHMGDVGI